MYRNRLAFFSSYSSRFTVFVEEEIQGLVELIQDEICPIIVFNNETFGDEAKEIMDNDFFLDLLRLEYPNINISTKKVLDPISENGEYKEFRMELKQV